VPGTLRLAVAQTTVPDDPADAGALRESGAQIRSLMRDAHASGATLAQFPEGAVVYPGKRVVSSAGPAVLAEADWTRADWDVMRTEAEAIAGLAGQLGLWTVFGHNYWVGYSTPAQYSRSAPAGIVAPGGRWIARCPANDQPAITVADLGPGLDPDIDGAIRFARPWHRVARSGLYDAHHAPDDSRSRNRTTF
jgi:hypothetical protein